MKILVAYYSRDGHTRKAAQEIAAQLQADAEEIVDQKDRRGLWGWLRAGWDAMKHRETAIGPVTRDPADYDLTVVGSPVWAGAMAPAVRTYIRQFKGKFKALACLVTTGNVKADVVGRGMASLAGKPAQGMLGLTAGDFKDAPRRQAKIRAIVEALRKQ